MPQTKATLEYLKRLASDLLDLLRADLQNAPSVFHAIDVFIVFYSAPPIVENQN